MTPAHRPRQNPGDQNGGGLFLRGIDPARMDISGRTLLLALLISVVAHAAIFATARKEPLGKIDPALLAPQEQVIRIHRAADDMVSDDNAVGPPIIASHPEVQATRPPTPAQAVRQTLEDNANLESLLPSQPSPLLTTPVVGNQSHVAGPDDPGPAGGLTDAGELGGAGEPTAPVGQAAGRGGHAGPQADLPDALSQPPALSHGVEIPFNSGPPGADANLSVNGGALVPGPGRGKSVAGTGTGGSGLARDALADQSTTPGVSLGPALLEPYRPSDVPPANPAAPAVPAPPPPIPSFKADIQPPSAIPANRLETGEHLDDDFDYVLSTINPTPQEAGYLRVDFVPRRTLHRFKTIPKDVVFLVDVSLSIPQPWAEQMAQGVRDSLASLNPGDRFNIVLFNQNMVFFKPNGVVPANDENIADADDFLSHVHAGGTTDINSAMGRLLVRDVGEARVYDIIFMSDGQPTVGVLDMRELLNLVTRDNDLSASIYCVGIGDEPNRDFLEFLAYRNKGICVYPYSERRTPGVIRGLMSRIRYPIISHVRVDVAGIDDSQVFPRDLPDIHQNESFSIFGRWQKPGGFIMRLTGFNAGKPVDLTFTRDLAQALPADHHLRHLWAVAKLYYLYSQMLSSGDTPQIRAQIEELKKDYGVKSLY